MNVRQIAIAFVAAALGVTCLAHASGLPGNSREAAWSLIWSAFEGEKLSASGTLRFRVHVEGESSALMSKESKDLDYVDFSWAPGKKFRIALMGKSGPLRTVVSDGKIIDTGLHLWDARFAWAYDQHSRGAHLDLRRKLDDEMWVYSALLTKHMHPLSGFENGLAADRFSKMFEMSVVQNPKATSAEVTLIRLDLGTKGWYHDNLQIQTVGNFAFARSNQPPGNMLGDAAYERADLVQIAGVGWLPRSCVITPQLRPKTPLAKYRWMSELVTDAPVKALTDADFAVKSDSSDLILWPYGSRMNNLWYGIVDTIQDWWEGVSDGVIGD